MSVGGVTLERMLQKSNPTASGSCGKEECDMVEEDFVDLENDDDDDNDEEEEEDGSGFIDLVAATAACPTK